MYSFSHMAFSMKNVTLLNNTHEYSYKLPHSWLEEIAPNEFGAKLCPLDRSI